MRFICGTQDRHKELEAEISRFLGTEDTILYSSCFDANGGLFETLLGAEDAIISDALNHASIIDGVRLCKAERHRYEHDDLADLEAKLRRHRRPAPAHDRHRRRVLHGRRHRARSTRSATSPRSTARWSWSTTATPPASSARPAAARPELRGCWDRVDVITSTLGKALGGASGGFTSGRREIVDLLRNRSRPYLFSNTLAPPIVAGSLEAIALIQRVHRAARPPRAQHACASARA